MATTADLRVGAFLKYNGELCQVLESEHRTPGNLRAFYQVKLRVLRNGKLLENRYRSGETIEFVRVERNDFQYLYRDGESYVFMDVNTYDQIPVDANIVGNAAKLMKENQEVQLTSDETTVLSVEFIYALHKPNQACVEILQPMFSSLQPLKQVQPFKFPFSSMRETCSALILVMANMLNA